MSEEHIYITFGSDSTELIQTYLLALSNRVRNILNPHIRTQCPPPVKSPLVPPILRAELFLAAPNPCLSVARAADFPATVDSKAFEFLRIAQLRVASKIGGESGPKCGHFSMGSVCVGEMGCEAFSGGWECGGR